jgi:hypothetical protein
MDCQQALGIPQLWTAVADSLGDRGNLMSWASWISMDIILGAELINPDQQKKMRNKPTNMW